MSYDDVVLSLIPRARRGGGGWLSASCPFCVSRKGTEDRGGAFRILEHHGFFMCWRCYARGRLRRLPEGWDPSLAEAPVEAAEPIDPPDGFLHLGQEPAWSSRAAQPALDYCFGRGLSPQVLWEARVGFCPSPEDWRLRRRVIIPILSTDREQWLGYVARRWYKWKDDPMPYLYSDDFSRRLCLYNSDALLVETDRPALVVEGAFDTFPYWPHAVAVLGTYSEEQAIMLSNARRPVCVFLDGDASAMGLALALKLRLWGVRSGSIRLPAGPDPDEVDPEWTWREAYRAVEEGPAWR